MAAVTDVYFSEKTVIDDITIPAGTETQIRVELGVGVMYINNKGKISSYKNIEYCKSEEIKDFEREVTNFTGMLDSNMCCFLFKEGQLVYLDISSAIGEDYYGQKWLRSIGIEDRSHGKFPVYVGSISIEDFEKAEKRLKDFRKGHGPEQLITLYQNRKMILKDPYQN